MKFQFGKLVCILKLDFPCGENVLSLLNKCKLNILGKGYQKNYKEF